MFTTRACTKFCLDSKHRALGPTFCLTFRPISPFLKLQSLRNELPSSPTAPTRSRPHDLTPLSLDFFHGFYSPQSGQVLHWHLELVTVLGDSTKKPSPSVNSLFDYSDFQTPLSRLSSNPPLALVFSLLSKHVFHNPCSEPTNSSFQWDVCKMPEGGLN